MDPTIFSRIPSELLSHILEETTLLDPDAPLLLSLVSRYFRYAVLASPRVWRQLHITNISEATDAKAITKAELWFSRSGQCDMAVTLEGKELNTHDQTLQHLTRRGKAQEWDGQLELPNVLRREAGRLISLTLRFPMEAQVRYFLISIYPAIVNGHGMGALNVNESTVDFLSNINFSSVPMNKLHALNIELLSPPRPSPHSTPAPVHLTPLPYLAHMRFTNYAPYLLSLPMFTHLHSLAIVGAIRAQPIQLHDLLGMLGATEKLRILDLEARVSVSPPPSPSPLMSTSSTTTTNDIESRDLLLLPHLTHLTLRTNNLLPVLGSFIVPSLHTLSIEDLDGNRPCAARETGEVLRQMLVRMDMPNAKHGAAKGLRELIISGVSFPPLLLEDWAPVWEWCLYRMRSLRRAEVPWIIGDLMLSCGPGHVEGREEDQLGNELPCADLEEVVLPRCPPDILKRFAMLRPGVEMLGR